MGAEARVHYDRGLSLYAAHQYPAAIEELRQGFALEPRREFLFAQAQAWRLSGNCPAATSLYRQFIESGPPVVQREAAQLGLDRCARDELRAPPPLAVPTRPVISPTAPSPAPRWWRDPWGLLSIGSGVAALGLAAGFELASQAAISDSRTAQTESEFDRRRTTGRQRREIAITALVSGVVLLAIGGTRLAMVRGREADRSSSDFAGGGIPAGIVLSIDGAAAKPGATLAWGGSF